MTLRVSELAAESIGCHTSDIAPSSVLFALTLDDDDGVLVVSRDTFDSDLLGIAIARTLLARASSTESFVSLYSAAATKLQGLGIAHLLRRVEAQNLAEVWALGSCGFRLMDIGITLSLRITGPIISPKYKDFVVCPSTESSIRSIAEAMVSHSWGSRYEADPDYSEERVRALHAQWLWNSHRGRADVVLVGIQAEQPAGYVTCRIDQSSGHGEIELVGTLPTFRGRGIASRILESAVAWFSTRTDFVTVRTQGTNYAAANLYSKSGFVLQRSDLTFRLSTGRQRRVS